jgi:hypothetical protein
VPAARVMCAVPAAEVTADAALCVQHVQSKTKHELQRTVKWG